MFGFFDKLCSKKELPYLSLKDEKNNEEEICINLNYYVPWTEFNLIEPFECLILNSTNNPEFFTYQEIIWLFSKNSAYIAYEKNIYFINRSGDIQKLKIENPDLLEKVLIGQENIVHKASQEQMIIITSLTYHNISSWHFKMKNAITEIEESILRRTEINEANYNRWNFLSSYNLFTSFLVPPSVYGIFWGLDAYVSYPLTHTPQLVSLYDKFKNTLAAYQPIKNSFLNFTDEVNSSFWNMIKNQGNLIPDNFKEFSNCFWQKGWQIYKNSTFIFPAELFLGHFPPNDFPDFFQKPQVFSERINNSSRKICNYFSIYSLKNQTIIPDYAFCQSNLQNLCKYLPKLDHINPQYLFMNQTINQLEQDINTLGGNYHFIPNSVFNTLLILVSVCTSGWFIYMLYFNYYKNRNEKNMQQSHINDYPIHREKLMEANLKNIFWFTNSTLLVKDQLTLPNDIKDVYKSLKQNLDKINGYFYFFCASQIMRLPKELTQIIIKEALNPRDNTLTLSPSI